jgi:hypothetical protein
VWLIAVPVLLLAFVVPPALGAPAAAPIAITFPPTNYANPFRLPAGRAPEVSLKEVMKRVALDSAGTLNSRLITIVGFTLRGSAAAAELRGQHLDKRRGHHRPARRRCIPSDSHNDGVNAHALRRTGQHPRLLTRNPPTPDHVQVPV